MSGPKRTLATSAKKRPSIKVKPLPTSKETGQPLDGKFSKMASLCAALCESKSRSEAKRIPGAAAAGKPPAKVKPRRRPLHPLEVMLGEKVKNSNGDWVSPKNFSTKDGVIGLYFSANWCPPCRTFTPRLKLLYEELKNKELPFEVIYVSFDHSEDSFQEYLSMMPWWAVDYTSEEKRIEIADKFNISGVPVLLFLDAGSLEIITDAGRDVVTVDPRGDYFPWKKMPDVAFLQKSLQAAIAEQTEREEHDAARLEAERLEAELASFGDDTLPKSEASSAIDLTIVDDGVPLPEEGPPDKQNG